MVAAFVGSASSEPFFVEMKDGSFRRCGNLSYKQERAEWRLRGCEPMERIFNAPTPAPVTPRPTVKPTATPYDPCPGKCQEWDPVTDTVRCVKCR